MNVTLEIKQGRWKSFGLIFCLFVSLVACKSEQKSEVDAGAETEQVVEPEGMQLAKIGDLVLEYEVQGVGEPILFIHGSAIANTYSTLMPEPLLSSYQLIRYHRRGFAGSSSVEAPFDMHDQAADVVALLEYLGIPKAHIVGHSYGASIALQLSLDYPERVHSVVLMEPPGIDIPGDQPPPQGIIDGFGFYQAGDPEGAVNAFLMWALGEDWEAEAELVAPGGPAQAKQDAKTFFEVEVPALGAWQFGEAQAVMVTQPSLYITGSLSVADITLSLPFLELWMPQLKSYVVEGANHALHGKKPEEVAGIIASFVSRYSFDAEDESVIMEQANIGNDVVLEYETVGTGEPILFVHGSAIANTFSTLMHEPALNNYQLIRYHRRGFSGSSGVAGPFSIKDQAADVAALIAFLDLQKAHIVGHSYGASIALQLALDYPEVVQSLVTMEPPGINILDGAPPPQGIIDGLGFYMAGEPEAAIDAFLKWALGVNWDVEAELAAPGGPLQAKQDSKTFFEIEVPALGQWQFGETEAVQVSQPMLYLSGSLSVSEITVSKPFLESWIPQAVVHTVEGVNHALHGKKPQEVAEVIEGFKKSIHFNCSRG